MATSFPPSGPHRSSLKFAEITPDDVSPSLSLDNACHALDQLSLNEVTLAPTMPSPIALQKAAQDADISVQDALNVYLTILNHK